MTIPTTRDRVPEHTAEHVNERIDRQIEENVRKYGGRPQEMSRRLKQLDEEWDIERAIEMNASALAFIGVALGFFHHPYWLALPALVTAFLSSMPCRDGARRSRCCAASASGRSMRSTGRSTLSRRYAATSKA